MTFFGKLFIWTLLYSSALNSFVICKIPKERKCADAECSKPISFAHTLIRYSADDYRFISFKPNVKATIFSKEVGDKSHVWEVEINGKRGYAPKEFFKEQKVLVKTSDLKYTVPTSHVEGAVNDTSENTTQSESTQTPELSAVNSKGFFNIIGGVSADSVPPNSPNIKPHSTKKVDIYDGTTIYHDSVNDNSQTPTDAIHTTEQNLDTSLPENYHLENKVEEKSTDNSDIQDIASKTKVKTDNDVPSKDTKASIVTQKELSDHKEGIQSETDSSEAIKSSGSEQNEEVAKDDYKHKESSVKGSKINKEDNKEKYIEKKTLDEDFHLNTPQEGVSDTKTDEMLSSNNAVNFSEASSVDNIFKKNTLSNLNVDSNNIQSNEIPEEVLPSNMARDEVKLSTSTEKSIDINETYPEDDFSLDEKTLNDTLNVVTNVMLTNTHAAVDSEINLLENDNVQQLHSILINDSVNHVEASQFSGVDDHLETKHIAVMNTNPQQNTTDESVKHSLTQSSKDYTSEPSEHSIIHESKHEQTTSQQFVFGKNSMQNENIQETAKANIKSLQQTENLSEDLEPEYNIKTASEVPDVYNTIPPSQQHLTEKKNFASIIENLSTKRAIKENEQEISEITENHKAVAHEESIPSDQLGILREEAQKYINGKSIEVLHQDTSPTKTSEVKSFIKSEDVSNEKVVDTVPSEPSDQLGILSEEAQKFINGKSVEVLPQEISPASEVMSFIKSEDDSDENVVDKFSESSEDISLEHFKTLAEDQSKVEDDLIDTVMDDSSDGIFSFLNPLLDFLRTTGISEDKIDEISKTDEEPKPAEPQSLDPSYTLRIKDESCLAEGVGEEPCNVIKGVKISKDISWQHSLYSDDMYGILDLLSKIPLETTIWLIVTSVVVLIFSLGHYYIEAHRRDGSLVAIINKLEQEVLILKKETCIMEDRLQTNQEQLEAWNTTSLENDALIIELKQELEETKVAKLELEEQVAVLDREVESVTESGLEIHRLLEESLSSQDGSQVLLTTVQTLREKLEHQENEITGLSQSLSRKNIEVEELQEKLIRSAEMTQGLEDRIIAVTRAKEEEALQLKDNHRKLIAQLEEVMETKALDETRVSAEMSKLRLTIEELQKTLAEKESELEAVKEVVKQLRSTDSNEKMDALFDVVGMTARFKAAVTERDDLREKFQEEEGARKLLEGHMRKITQEVTELKNSFETAEKEKIEALTKLQVLSNYFKEKESQLQKELGLQESMWLQKQSDDHTIYEQMRSLREENEKYKLQNESLKKEIVEQESSFKIQLANVEQKSHENWVASRQAERRLKEVQQEAAQLRNRLTTNSANYSLDDSKQNISESNGDPSSPPPSLMFPPTASPPFMMYPIPPPGDFILPPPLLGSPYPSDSRPPPLGRISSPPLDHRFSPPPPLPYPPYDYPSYGHHSPSPPPPAMPSRPHHRNVHKPQPRDMSRDQKDHMMPNYSPESEKPIRRNNR